MDSRDGVCATCYKPCAGEAIRHNDALFHVDCFVCRACKKSLDSLPFYVHDDLYYCVQHYQELYGVNCFVCKKFVEGEVITAMGNTYHADCFVCSQCRKPFPAGEKVTLNGSDYLCQECANAPPPVAPVEVHIAECAGCSQEIKTGQALLALDKQWHLWCFTCTKCGCLLAGEYMGREGKPYCEKDYQAEFGVTCAGCNGYITGKVLQAGEKHYHPKCSRCARCHMMFGEGEEMYLQGSEIWHPDCSAAAAQEMAAANGQAEDSSRKNEAQKQPLTEVAMPPPPPTRTSASRTTDWRTKYSNPAQNDVQTNQNQQRSFHHEGSRDDAAPAVKDFRDQEPNTVYRSNVSVPFGNGTERVKRYSSDSSALKPSVAGFVNSLNEQERITETPSSKLYSYDELKTTNYKLPRGVDKTKLETYLSDEDFDRIFSMSRSEFYRLPAWKQQQQKRGKLLF